MAEKESPKPKLFDPLLGKKEADILADYQKLFTKGAKAEYQIERGNLHRYLANQRLMLMSQHGVDEKTKQLKYRSFQHIKDEKLRRQWVQDWLAHYAAAGIQAVHGQKSLETFLNPENHDDLKKFITDHMATEHLGSYDAIVEYLMNHENLVDGFEQGEDQVLNELQQKYVHSVNSESKKKGKYTLFLRRHDALPHIAEFANKKAAGYGMEFGPHTPLEHYVGFIHNSADPEWTPKANKYLKAKAKKAA